MSPGARGEPATPGGPEATAPPRDAPSAVLSTVAPPRLDAAALGAVAALWRRAGHQVAAVFTGDSMRPTIEPGQEVMLDCGRKPRVGDVVACRCGDGLLVHRVIAVRSAWLLTRGDARMLPDPPVATADVVGCVVEARTHGDMASLAAAPRGRVRALLAHGAGLAFACSPDLAAIALRGIHGVRRRLLGLVVALRHRL